MFQNQTSDEDLDFDISMIEYILENLEVLVI